MALIVVVEDDGALRNDISDRLTAWGHKVIQANNGRQGLTVIADVRPDIVLSDINMPVESGFDLVRKVSELGSEYAELAFIFMSTVSDPKAMVFGLHHGADDYVVKPIDYNVLKAKIESHLRKSHRLSCMYMLDQVALSLRTSMVRVAVIVSAVGVLGIVAILALYILKSALGINIFADIHFSDLF